MTTPRTMTVSELTNHLFFATGREAAEFAKSLVGVTIVPDPEPRPDFDEMTAWEVNEWCFDNSSTVVHLERYETIRNEVVKLANDIADERGMGR